MSETTTQTAETPSPREHDDPELNELVWIQHPDLGHKPAQQVTRAKAAIKAGAGYVVTRGPAPTEEGGTDAAAQDPATEEEPADDDAPAQTKQQRKPATRKAAASNEEQS